MPFVRLLNCIADKSGALNVGERVLGTVSKPLSEAGAYWHGPNRRSSSTATATLRTSPCPWVQPPAGNPHGVSRRRMSDGK